MPKSSEILAYTPTFGQRPFVHRIAKLRATAGTWFDWLVCVGDPTPAYRKELTDSMGGTGIQKLCTFEANVGQHYATAFALKYAREQGYKWLLRLDDDVEAKSKRWLSTMIERVETLKSLAGDDTYRIVAAPRVVGLLNPIPAVGAIQLNQSFPVDIMPLLGGVCRLHPVEFLADYEPPLLAPRGRKDPESIAAYCAAKEGLLLRFPDIRVIHNTKELVALESEEEQHSRQMAKYWPHIPANLGYEDKP